MLVMAVVVHGVTLCRAVDLISRSSIPYGRPSWIVLPLSGFRRARRWSTPWSWWRCRAKRRTLSKSATAIPSPETLSTTSRIVGHKFLSVGHVLTRSVTPARVLAWGGSIAR